MSATPSKHVHTTQSWYRDVTSRGRSDAIGPHLLALLATSCMELQVDLSNAGSRSSAPQLGTAGRSHLVILWDILQAMNRTMSGFIMGWWIEPSLAHYGVILYGVWLWSKPCLVSCKRWLMEALQIPEWSVTDMNINSLPLRRVWKLCSEGRSVGWSTALTYHPFILLSNTHSLTSSPVLLSYLLVSVHAVLNTRTISHWALWVFLHT